MKIIDVILNALNTKIGAFGLSMLVVSVLLFIMYFVLKFVYRKLENCNYATLFEKEFNIKLKQEAQSVTLYKNAIELFSKKEKDELLELYIKYKTKSYNEGKNGDFLVTIGLSYLTSISLILIFDTLNQSDFSGLIKTIILALIILYVAMAFTLYIFQKYLITKANFYTIIIMALEETLKP